MGCGMDLWGILRVSIPVSGNVLLVVGLSAPPLGICRELAEPQKLLTHLLQPRVLILDTETIAVYVQAALKIFGVWTAELADRWDNDDLPKVKGMVDNVVEQLGEFVSNSDIEVQERVSICIRFEIGG